MTAYPPYQAYPGPAPVLIAPPPVLVVAADPAPQRRVTVFFRLILAIPHLFLLYWLYLAAGIVAFIGWWVALFTGRLPQFAVTYLSGVLRWTARVYAYDYLLTDAYPPFTFDDDPTYPVRVAIPEPQRLNRAAVFFRYFLILPVGILAGIVISGASTLMSFIAWLIALVAGQLPPSLYLAYVAVVRFQTRYYAYWWMLTPAYPGGLYGDKPGSVAWADQGYEPSQGYGTPGYGAPAGYGAPDPGYGAPGGYGVRPLFQPTTWLLPLTTAAKKLVTTFIVLGSLILVGYIALYAALIGSTVSSTENAVAAANQLNSSYTTLTNSLNAWDQASTNCKGNLACVTKEDGKAASAFNTFSSQLANTSVPAGAAADKARLSAAAATSAQDFIQLSKTTSISQYQSTIASTGLQRALSGFDQDFTALITRLQTY
ncbi:MAG: hypothetical protein QOG28_4227 [Trebonia sp.]|nr:hypothetical protein [Trebonia sp.]